MKENNEFRDDNTEGFTQTQLDDLNKRWDTLADEMGLDKTMDPDKYNPLMKEFSDINCN